MSDVKDTTKPRITEVKKVRIFRKPSTPVIVAFATGLASGVFITLGVQALFGDNGSVTVDIDTPAS